MKGETAASFLTIKVVESFEGVWKLETYLFMTKFRVPSAARSNNFFLANSAIPPICNARTSLVALQTTIHKQW